MRGHTWRRVCSGSHERLLVLCPACQAADWLNHEQIALTGNAVWEEIKPEHVRRDRLARWVCRFCGVHHDSEAVRKMAREAVNAERWCAGTWSVSPEHPQGHWKAHLDQDRHGRIKLIHPVESIYRSAHINSLFSLDYSLDLFAAARADALQKGESGRKVYVNNEEAGPYLRSVTALDTDQILSTTSPPIPYEHGKGLPWDVDFVLLIFDQQGNTREQWWFPFVVRGYRKGGESWLIEAGTANSIAERDQLSEKTWIIAGRARRATAIAMDCGNGNFLYDAYLWAALEPLRRILVRGDPRAQDGVPWVEVIDRPGTRRKISKPANVREWKVHPHFWRHELWDRIRVKPAAGGVIRPRWWQPDDAPTFYRNSLTSEEVVEEKRRIPGGYVTAFVWRPRVIASAADHVSVRKDNHWWDNEANALALSHIFGWHIAPPKPQTHTHDEPETSIDETPTPARARIQRRASLMRRH